MRIWWFPLNFPMILPPIGWRATSLQPVRSWLAATGAPVSEDDLMVMPRIDALHPACLFYRSRRMAA